MANYSNLIAAIQATIYNNGQNLITGSALQGVLIDMVQELGQAGAVFGGVVDRDFTPAATDSNIFYIAAVPGTYSGFGQSVSVGEFAIFYFDGSDWQKATVTSAEVEVTPGNENGITLATINVGGQNYLIKAEVKDSTPTPNSTHPVESGGVASAIATAVQNLNNALALKADKTYVDNQLATKADANATTTALASKVDKVPAAEAGNVAMFDATGGIEDSEVPADNLAQQDGYYSPMIVGAAENLVGQDVQTAQFTRRVSGGSADVGTGAALIKSIKGNTLVWNQMAQNGNFANGTTGWARRVTADDWSVSDGTLTITKGQTSLGAIVYQSPSGLDTTHKYYMAATIRTLDANVQMNFGFHTSSYTVGSNTILDTGSTTFVRKSQITSPVGNTNILTLRLGTASSALNSQGQAKDVVLIDLTQMFGSGNEPSTAAEFEALFPLNYYAYNAGSLLNFTGTGILNDGFNQWDGTYSVIGSYIKADGSLYADPYCNVTDYIPVLPSTAYYLNRMVYSGAVNAAICFYDVDKNYISGLAGAAYIYNKTVTTPANARYARCTVYLQYLADTCINFSNSARNGEREDYWTDTFLLPITTAQSGGSAVFADGMKSIDGLHDRYYKSAGSDFFDKAEKVIGSVDLGDMEWTYNSAGYFISTSIASLVKNAPGWAVKGNLLCTIYTNTYANDVTNNHTSGTMAVAPSASIYIANSAYTDAPSFTTAMAGVKLYFELKNPTDYTLDTPFSAQYRVDGMGTETLLPQNTATPTTSPINAEVKYPMNAVDTLRNLPQNYISKASMDAILTAFKTAGVITNYTLTWDSTNNKYNCTITV